MRYKEEKSDLKYVVNGVFPILNPYKCKFCEHFFIREFGFKIDSYSFNLKIYDNYKLHNVFMCKVCAKTRREAVDLFNANLDKFKHEPKNPPRE